MKASESAGKDRSGPAGSRPGDGEIETSLSEKILALVLAVFIGIGAVWGYVKLDEVAEPSSTPYASVRSLLSAEEFSALQADRKASSSLQRARAAQSAATRQMELRREAYRTALDAGEPATELQAEYEAAQADLTSAARELGAAAATARRTRPAAAEARAELTEQQRSAAQRAEDDRVRHDRIVFLLRLGLLTLMLAAGYRLLIRLRSRNPRYLPVALALIGATAILACAMALDYTNSYLGFSEVGPLTISIAGIALTLAAFIALQRFIAKRVPARRVRRGECPFCGFPLRDKPHCEGCGRATIASCSACHGDRRVGAARCGACGSP